VARRRRHPIPHDRPPAIPRRPRLIHRFTAAGTAWTTTCTAIRPVPAGSTTGHARHAWPADDRIRPPDGLNAVPRAGQLSDADGALPVTQAQGVDLPGAGGELGDLAEPLQREP